MPEGAKSWKAQPDSEITVKLEKQGVYLVECNMHKTMGMVAVIQAGKPINLAAAKKMAEEKSAKMMVGKDRFSKALAQVKQPVPVPKLHNPGERGLHQFL